MKRRDSKENTEEEYASGGRKVWRKGGRGKMWRKERGGKVWRKRRGG